VLNFIAFELANQMVTVTMHPNIVACCVYAGAMVHAVLWIVNGRSSDVFQLLTDYVCLLLLASKDGDIFQYP